MAQITLGSTGIRAEQNGFGALPIQRDDTETAVAILRRAYEGGMRFFDTSRAYTDSEEKIGLAFGDMDIRNELIIATKTMSRTPEGIREDIETSLRLLKTDYVDIYQVHLAPECYLPGDGTGIYETMEELKKEGKIRHIGLTAHSLKVAHDCIDSGKYETLQFPFSYLAGEPELELVRKCKEKNMGFIVMKALAGGLITNAAAAYAYIAKFDNAMPIWGVQHMWELKQFLAFMEEEPVLTEELQAVIDKDRAELCGDFCRSCGYCMPCPEGIEIRQVARMSLLLRRSPHKPYLTEEWQEKMKKTENCTACGKCKKKCPYGLDIPTLIKKNYEDYQKIVSGEISLEQK